MAPRGAAAVGRIDGRLAQLDAPSPRPVAADHQPIESRHRGLGYRRRGRCLIVRPHSPEMQCIPANPAAQRPWSDCLVAMEPAAKRVLRGRPLPLVGFPPLAPPAAHRPLVSCGSLIGESDHDVSESPPSRPRLLVWPLCWSWLGPEAIEFSCLRPPRLHPSGLSCYFEQ